MLISTQEEGHLIQENAINHVQKRLMKGER